MVLVLFGAPKLTNKQAFPFIGVLFTGLMITRSGPRVLEYNVRFGDPETQTLLPLLSPETDLAEIMFACTDRYLDAVTIKLREEFAATVVVAAGGYPGSYAKGTDIQLSPPPEGTCHLFGLLTSSHWFSMQM